MSAILRTSLGRSISSKFPAVHRGYATASGTPGASPPKDPQQSQIQLAIVLAIGAGGAYYLFGDGFRSHRSEQSSTDPGSSSSVREKMAPSEGQASHAPNPKN